MVRLLAYAGDFSLGQLAFHSLISVTHVRALFESMRSLISLEGSGGDALASLVSIYLLTTVIRFYSSAILGVSCFQWLLGITNGLNGLSGRLYAAARVAIEFVLIPTLIPLLPILSQKPTWIERLSSAYLKKGSGVRGFLGLIARPLTLLFILFGVFAPLLRNLAVIEGVHVAFSEIAPNKIEANDDFTKFRFFSSNYFGFTTFSDLEAERFVLLPQFEVTKDGSDTKIRPFVGIFDQKNKSLGNLKKEGQINWQALIMLAKRGNPFFSSSYPFLEEQLHSTGGTILEAQAINDLEELIIASLELSFKNVFNHVKKHGPFLGGHVDLRQAILGMLDTGAVPRADTVNLGDKKFLRLRQLFDEVPTIEKKYREVLLPLETMNGYILRYEWDASMEAAISRRDFATTFFSQAKWQELDQRKTNIDKKNLSSLSMLDFLLDKSLDDKSRELLHEYTYRWFWEKARAALQANDQELMTWLKLSMARIYLVTHNQLQNEKLSKMFLMMQHSLERREKDFFDLGRKKNE